MNPNGPIENPDLRALLNAHRDEIFSSFNCHQIGTIVSFDKDRQSATVRINAQRVVFDKPQTTTEGLQQQPRVLDYPALTDVPVFFASGGNARLTLPIAAGDTCLLLFNDRDLDAWWTTGGTSAPNSSRMHSLSDALALVGFRSLANKVEDYSGTDAELRFGDAVVSIAPDGTITLKVAEDGPSAVLAPDGTIVLAASDATATMKADGEVEILSAGAARLALKADGTAVISHGSDEVVVNPDGSVEMKNSAGAKVRIASKVKINGASGDLLTALNAVVTALTALNAKTGPSAAAQIALAQTAITDLLE
jgi:hypothetical protein